MTNIPISVCIIAKNEEKHIAECLKRLCPDPMELVVADTGSTDATKKLARQYADKVLDMTWTDSFSDARNFCAAQASNNWILAIDCDEYVTGGYGCPECECQLLSKIQGQSAHSQSCCHERRTADLRDGRCPTAL